jgi:3-deoxy-manno-octulosonate cytidylyltransferase (CMP-KDO synthetase)
MRGRKICIIIPARLNSSRFPGKPLVDINGKSMIRRVYEKCEEIGVDKIIVSTEDQEIYDHVTEFGECDLTPTFQNGTLRVCHTAIKFGNEFDYIINLQGDEPFIDINFIKRFISDITSLKSGTVLTGASELKVEQMINPNCVKLIFNKSTISGFTRSPFFNPPQNILKHVGVYGFCSCDIQRISLLGESELSKRDSLEQISWMEDGFCMKYTMCYNEAISIDTPEDLIKGLDFLNNL